MQRYIYTSVRNSDASGGEFGLSEYQTFMENYVRRINEATLNVRFGGVRIGTARYTRLAQINLQTRIITFSRYAIENVPERGRRYLVLHELAHVREARHNRRFWSMVAKYEPDYRRIGREIQQAFKKNVEHQVRLARKKFKLFPDVDRAQLLQLPRQLMLFGPDNAVNIEAEVDNPDTQAAHANIDCVGVISGGYEADHDPSYDPTNVLWHTDPEDHTIDIF